MTEARAAKSEAGRLPKNARRVHDVLRAADRPMTAYDLLDALRDEGVTAPLTVYRALRRLIADGLAHRLESLNAYVICAHPPESEGAGAGDAHAPAFIVCEGCGAVDEIEDSAAMGMLTDDARRKGYAVSRMAVEMLGECRACRDGAGTG
jgi:Fur family zinc uptake transcriptional regulator